MPEKKAQEELRYLQKITSTGMWEWGHESKQLFFSEELYRILGIQRSEAQDKLLSLALKRVRSDYRRILRESVQRAVATGEMKQLELVIIRPDGEERWVRIEGTWLHDYRDSFKRLVGTVQDITNLKHAEMAFLESQNFLQTIFDTIPSPIFFKDRTGVYRYCNSAFCNYLGLTREEIIGHVVYEVSPMDLARIYHMADLKLVADGGRQVYEARAAYADGTLRNVLFNKGAVADSSGRVTGIVGIMVDITDRKVMEERLRESEERYRVLFNSSYDGILVYQFNLNPRMMKCVEVNDVACNRLGYSREEIVSLSIGDIDTGKTPEEMSEILTTLNRNKHLLFESIHHGKDEVKVPVEINARLLEFDGEIYVLAVARDISERLMLEKNIEQMKRLEMVGNMAASIAHEIRNPMTTVRGFLQLLGQKKEYQEDDCHFQLMIEELDRANSILTEYLCLASNRALELRMQNLNHIINALWPIIEADAIMYDKTIELDLRPVAELMLDANEIRQLIINLVRNGLEAMEPGGRLTIGTREQDGEVTMYVKDQGKGIETGILEKLGTPFITTKQHGTGLGLAVCYSIASRHQARINIESTSQGTTFRVTFAIPGRKNDNHTPARAGRQEQSN